MAEPTDDFTQSMADAHRRPKEEFLRHEALRAAGVHVPTESLMPTPWKAVKVPGGRVAFIPECMLPGERPLDAGGAIPGMTETKVPLIVIEADEEHREFILRACNAHGALLRAAHSGLDAANTRPGGSGLGGLFQDAIDKAGPVVEIGGKHG